MSRWNLRVTNNCLFVDEIESGRIVLQHNARPGMRPYIHPLRGPDGRACLTEDSPWHHPWQHGVQTGFHGVNGCDFWFDPGQQAKVVIGTIEPSAPSFVSESPATWSIAAMWRHADGSELMAEQQTWSLQAAEDMLYLDLAWRMEAIPDVQIEQGLYGGLFVRMPFRADREARVISATGLQDDATEQQAAAWVDVRMPVDGGGVWGGMAILDHPQNPGHPTHWRVDGQRGINPAPCIPGPIELAAGEGISYRYRLILHDGSLGPERIQDMWNAYGEAT